MSAWRKEASRRLPEFQKLITAPIVDSPTMLWIDLQTEFTRLCEQKPPDLELLRRIWGYATWCMEHGHPEVSSAAAVGFCEDLLASESSARLLPQIMSRRDYESIKSLLLYHNSPEEYERGLKLFAATKTK